VLSSESSFSHIPTPSNVQALFTVQSSQKVEEIGHDSDNETFEAQNFEITIIGERLQSILIDKIKKGDLEFDAVVQALYERLLIAGM